MPQPAVPSLALPSKDFGKQRAVPPEPAAARRPMCLSATRARAAWAAPRLVAAWLRTPFSFRGNLVIAVGEISYFHVFLTGSGACSLSYRGDVRRSNDGFGRGVEVGVAASTRFVFEGRVDVCTYEQVIAAWLCDHLSALLFYPFVFFK